MIAAEGMRLRACALFYFVPYTGGRHLRHLHRRSVRCYYALIAVLGRALSTSYARYGPRPPVPFPLLGYTAMSLTCSYLPMRKPDLSMCYLSVAGPCFPVLVTSRRG